MLLLKWLTRFCLACFVAAVVLAVVVISLLSGCSYLDSLIESHPDTRIVLERGQRMDFNMMTKKNAQGQDISEFRCAKPPMICEGRVISMECRCDL